MNSVPVHELPPAGPEGCDALRRFLRTIYEIHDQVEQEQRRASCNTVDEEDAKYDCQPA